MEGSGQAISGTVTDGAANTATKVVAFNLDKTPPTLAVTSPANGATVLTPVLALTGTVTDALSGIATFTCNGQTAALNGPNFSCNLPLVPGANLTGVRATSH